MRIANVCWILTVIGVLGCSQTGGQAGCPQGMMPCGATCLPTGFACGASDASGGGQDASVDDASLSALSLSGGSLSPEFSPTRAVYSARVSVFATTVQVTATAVQSGATIEINGQPVASGVASAPIALANGPTMIAVRVQSQGGAQMSYDIAITKAPIDYIKASNTGTGDLFAMVALSGDTLAVAATSEESNATGVDGNQADNSAFASGAVYVFTRAGSTWSQQAYIKASNTEALDQFGLSLSLSGDTLAVGTYMEASSATGVNGNQADNSAPRSGAVYVFQRTGTTWRQQAYIKASNAQAYDQFGYSVSVSGDTLAVGAMAEDSNATGVDGNQADNSASGSGAVYVFTRSGSTWSQQAYIKASNTEANDQFGTSVAVSGDTLTVGATMEASNATGANGNQADNSAPGSGAVYVFQRVGTTWSQQAYIKASNTNGADYFGTAVSLSGDTLAVSATGEDSNATGVDGNQANNDFVASGAVYVFQRTGTTWSQQAYIKASNTERDDLFGTSISLSGDLLVVGAYTEGSGSRVINVGQNDNSALSSGAGYLFQRVGTTWRQQAYIKAPNSERGDYFGYRVAVSDGTVAIGALNEADDARGVNDIWTNNRAPGSGAVYVFR
ncbi:MAG: cadherin-like beta sandwich domain-containing protein [Myxococcales bacterium]|nr:cadherin-like beta sandwich domain-containing protein [Myxococcales bacterium]